MHRSARIASAVAVAASLITAPAALADSSYSDTTGAGLIHASMVKPAKTKTLDTTGVGLIHASMVEAQVAGRTATASSDPGFQWPDAGIGAAAGFGAALAVAGIGAGVRSRRRIVA